MVLTDVPALVGVPVCSSVGISEHSAVFIDVVLGQPIPHLVCRLDDYLKNTVDWEQVREDMKGLNWNETIRSPCPVSLLNEALLRVIKNRVPKRTIVVRKGNKPWFDDRCVLLTMQYKRHLECGVVVRYRLIGRSIGWLVVMLSLCTKILNEYSLDGANHECTKSTEAMVYR